MSDCMSCDTWKATCQGIIDDLKTSLAAHGETPEADQLRAHWCEAFSGYVGHVATHLAEPCDGHIIDYETRQARDCRAPSVGRVTTVCACGHLSTERACESHQRELEAGRASCARCQRGEGGHYCELFADEPEEAAP